MRPRRHASCRLESRIAPGGTPGCSRAACVPVAALGASGLGTAGDASGGNTFHIRF